MLFRVLDQQKGKQNAVVARKAAAELPSRDAAQVLSHCDHLLRRLGRIAKQDLEEHLTLAQQHEALLRYFEVARANGLPGTSLAAEGLDPAVKSRVLKDLRAFLQQATGSAAAGTGGGRGKESLQRGASTAHSDPLGRGGERQPDATQEDPSGGACVGGGGVEEEPEGGDTKVVLALSPADEEARQAATWHVWHPAFVPGRSRHVRRPAIS